MDSLTNMRQELYANNALLMAQHAAAHEAKTFSAINEMQKELTTSTAACVAAAGENTMLTFTKALSAMYAKFDKKRNKLSNQVQNIEGRTAELAHQSSAIKDPIRKLYGAVTISQQPTSWPAKVETLSDDFNRVVDPGILRARAPERLPPRCAGLPQAMASGRRAPRPLRAHAPPETRTALPSPSSSQAPDVAARRARKARTSLRGAAGWRQFEVKPSNSKYAPRLFIDTNKNPSQLVA